MRILTIDDHNLLLDGLSRILADIDSITEVITQDNAEAAIEFVLDNPDIELILIDINMPGMNGLSFLHALNSRDILIPTVVLSATENLNEIKKAFDNGAIGFIPKSYSSSQVKDALEQIFTLGEFIPENLRAMLLEMEQHRDQTNTDHHGLSQRQLAVLELVAEGHTNRMIGHILNISENTVKTHLQAIFEMLGVSNRTGCVAKAKQLKLIKA